MVARALRLVTPDDQHVDGTRVQLSIHCTDDVQLLLADMFEFEPRGVVDIKGKGQMSTYFLTGARS